MKIKLFITILLIVVFLSSCASTSSNNNSYEKRLDADSFADTEKSVNVKKEQPKEIKKKTVKKNNKKVKVTKRVLKPYTYNSIDSVSMENDIKLSKANFLNDDNNTNSNDALFQDDSDSESKKIITIVQGFRIQVYATTNFKEAERKRQDLLSALEERVYAPYEAPYYKIRVGNFETEAEAKSLKRKIKELGYDAWIVPSKVRVKK